MQLLTHGKENLKIKIAHLDYREKHAHPYWRLSNILESFRCFVVETSLEYSLPRHRFPLLDKHAGKQVVRQKRQIIYRNVNSKLLASVPLRKS